MQFNFTNKQQYLNQQILFKFEYEELVHKIRQSKLDIKNADRELAKQPLERDRWGGPVYKAGTPWYNAYAELQRKVYAKNDLDRAMIALITARQNARIEAHRQWLEQHINKSENA